MKNKIRFSKLENTRYGTYLLDLFCLAVFLCFFILELIRKIELEGDNIVFDAITILFPAIITVLSITITLAKDKIYGISRIDFNHLRGSFCYSFLHMIIVLISIFFIYFFVKFYNCNISLIVLDAIVIFYSTYFSIQEIPVLLQNKKSIIRIVRKRFKKRKASFAVGIQTEEDKLVDMIENILINEGIITTFNSLNFANDVQYNSELMNSLITIQTNYFLKLNIEVEFVKKNIIQSYNGIEINKAIQSGYDNLNNLLNYKNEYKLSNVSIYGLTRTLFALHRINENLHIVDNELIRLNTLSRSILSFDSLSKDYLFNKSSFILLMTIYSIKNNKTRFLELLRDNSFSSVTFFTIESPQYAIFISVLIVYLNNTFPSEFNSLIQFFDLPVGGLNGDGRSWREHIKTIFEFTRIEAIIDLINGLFDIYNSIEEVQFEIYPERIEHVIHDYHIFSKTDLFDFWLEAMLYHFNTGVDLNKIVDILNSFSNEYKKLLVYHIREEWVKDRKLNKEYKIKYMKYFNKERETISEVIFNEYFMPSLEEFCNNYLKEEYENTLQKSNNRYNNDEIRDKFIKAFNEAKNNKFFNQELELNGEKFRYYSIRIDDFENKGLVDMYAKELENSINYLINSEITKLLKEGSSIDIDCLKDLSEESFLKKYSFKPVFKSPNYFFHSSNSYENHIDEIDNKVLPHNFYGEKDCIAFNLDIDEDKTFARKLSREECEAIIDKEFETSNGMYKYSQFKNNNMTMFLVTKEELIEYLLESIVYICLVFRVRINVNKEKCLYISRKK